jgi:hypothetical protein
MHLRLVNKFMSRPTIWCFGPSHSASPRRQWPTASEPLPGTFAGAEESLGELRREALA